jgi:carboxypeptidase Q
MIKNLLHLHHQKYPMKKTIYAYIAFLILLNTATYAQEEKVDYSVISRIKEEALDHSQVMNTLFNLTDVSGPRLTGSANLKSAQQYVIQQMNDWQIEGAHLEPWGTFGKGWEINRSYIAMTKPYYQPLTGAPKAWTSGTNGPVNEEAVLVKAETEQDLEKYKGKLAGKIVVVGSSNEIKPGFTPDAKRYTDDDLKNLYLNKNMEEVHDDAMPVDREKFRAARALRQKINAFLSDEHPALILSARGGMMGTFNTTNGASYAMDAKAALPEMEMAPEHLYRIIRLLEAGKEVRIEAEIATTFNEKDTLQYNVIAEIPGTDKKLKEEVVMIGAHLDSWHSATGSTDNAAGCAVMMEVMRILKTLDVHPRRTIRIALWSGEEQGILGSKGYVKAHFGDVSTMELKPEHQKLSVYFNLDNGGGKIRGIYLQGNDALRPVFEEWLKPFADMGATTVTNRSTGSTDHIPFDQVGLPGLQFIQDPMDYFSKTHHTNMDTYDRIQKADLMQASAIIASLVYDAAMRNEKLPRKSLPKPKAAEKK